MNLYNIRNHVISFICARSSTSRSFGKYRRWVGKRGRTPKEGLVTTNMGTGHDCHHVGDCYQCKSLLQWCSTHVRSCATYLGLQSRLDGTNGVNAHQWIWPSFGSYWLWVASLVGRRRWSNGIHTSSSSLLEWIRSRRCQFGIHFVCQNHYVTHLLCLLGILNVPQLVPSHWTSRYRLGRRIVHGGVAFRTKGHGTRAYLFCRKGDYYGTTLFVVWFDVDHHLHWKDGTGWIIWQVTWIPRWSSQLEALGQDHDHVHARFSRGHEWFRRPHLFRCRRRFVRPSQGGQLLALPFVLGHHGQYRFRVDLDRKSTKYFDCFIGLWWYWLDRIRY